MKKVTLSALAALMVSGVAYADTLTLYTDPTTGQVFTTPGEGRIEMGDFVDAKTVYLENQAQDSAVAKKFAKEEKKNGKLITIERKDSPEFLLGKESHINMKIKAQDNPDMWLKAGVRIQGTFENVKEGNADATSDAYLRRTRFEIQAGFDKHTSFTMDVRNDKANYEDKGEQDFNVGDAYVAIKKPFDTSLVNFKLYRGKIDISRTETVKSARVLHYDRPQVADEAAQYISHNRRGTNVSMNGDWNKKVHYQVAVGDGVHSGKFKDATGGSFGGDLTQRSFFYGGKIRLSPFDGWEETQRTETYFGQGQHFSIGASYWKSPDIAYDDGLGVVQEIDHELINCELSAHYKGFFIQAEYFDFDGVVRDWGSSDTGSSDGYYVTGEYVMPELAYLAPFFRYESWDKFDGASGYDFKSTIIGANWYLRGNTTKVGLAYVKDEYGVNIGDETVKKYKLTSQWFF